MAGHDRPDEKPVPDLIEKAEGAQNEGSDVVPPEITGSGTAVELLLRQKSNPAIDRNVCVGIGSVRAAQHLRSLRVQTFFDVTREGIREPRGDEIETETRVVARQPPVTRDAKIVVHIAHQHDSRLPRPSGVTQESLLLVESPTVPPVWCDRLGRRVVQPSPPAGGATVSVAAWCNHPLLRVVRPSRSQCFSVATASAASGPSLLSFTSIQNSPPLPRRVVRPSRSQPRAQRAAPSPPSRQCRTHHTPAPPATETVAPLHPGGRATPPRRSRHSFSLRPFTVSFG